MFNHLKVILDILAQVMSSESVAALLATKVVRCSVGRSTQRVHNYVRRLCNTIPGPMSGVWTVYDSNGAINEGSCVRYKKDRPS